jgi:hypothetical protein
MIPWRWIPVTAIGTFLAIVTACLCVAASGRTVVITREEPDEVEEAFRAVHWTR